jgi:hypothetical protein
MSITGNMEAIMATPRAQRDVVRVDSPDIGRGMSDAHRVRPLVPPGCPSLAVSQARLRHQPPRETCTGLRGRRASQPLAVSGISFAYSSLSQQRTMRTRQGGRIGNSNGLLGSPAARGGARSGQALLPKGSLHALYRGLGGASATPSPRAASCPSHSPATGRGLTPQGGIRGDLAD